ncbi:MAG: HEAT repeat domain-containing protein [Anaerolineaceae bacterium]|nr:MAG: HEAT repeat domain-containing protein [Anaerolineaceae bacterium]
MSAVKRMLDYHINRLKDKRPEARLKAIQELALLGHPDALDVLRDVYENDEDIEVRKAAQQAGRAIFLNQKGE